jgi:hypothetical protein
MRGREMSKPPPEFVTWYMLPEQKEFRERVNEEKKRLGWDAGDWYTYGSGTVEWVAWLVDEHELRAFDKAGESKLREENVCWLPSLSDLLDMIKGAAEAKFGDEFRALMLDYIPDRDEWRAILWPPGLMEARHKEPEIAAAELLRRLWGAG